MAVIQAEVPSRRSWGGNTWLMKNRPSICRALGGISNLGNLTVGMKYCARCEIFGWCDIPLCLSSLSPSLRLPLSFPFVSLPHLACPLLPLPWQCLPHHLQRLPRCCWELLSSNLVRFHTKEQEGRVNKRAKTHYPPVNRASCCHFSTIEAQKLSTCQNQKRCEKLGAVVSPREVLLKDAVEQ